MSYTTAAAIGVVATIGLDVLVLRTKLLVRKAFWVSYAIILAFQLVVNGILTGRGLVTYSPDTILGQRVVHAPVEDLAFGFSLVVQTLAWWVWWGRRLHHARTSAGAATAARDARPTRARRSSTR